MTRTSKIENRGRRVGHGLTRWAKWKRMPPLARSLWMGLYASNEASQTPIGLWWGDVGDLARASALSRDDVELALAQLTADDVDAVRYEQLEDETLVLRMTELPDRVEGAHSPTVVYGWWSKFGSVPACRTRDEHLALLWWLCGVAADDPEKMAKVAAAWSECFGRYAVAAGLGPIGPDDDEGDPTGEGTGEGTPYPTGEGKQGVRGGVPGTSVRGERREERSGSSSSGSQIRPALPGDPDAEIATAGPEGGPAEIATTLWAGVIERLSERVLAQHVDMWLAPITATALDGTVLQLRAPNTYVRTWFESQYREAVVAELRELTGCELRVVVEVDQQRTDAAAAGVDDLAARAMERYGPARAAAAGRSGR